MVTGNHNLESVPDDAFVGGVVCRVVRLSLRAQATNHWTKKKGLSDG